MRLLKSLVALGAMLALLGCEEKVDQAAKEAAPKDKLAEQGTPTSAKETTVKLLEAGADPKRVLRYDFSNMEAQTLEMTMEMAMGMQLGANRQPEVQLPPVKMSMQVKPEKVSDDGTLRYSFSLDSADVVKGTDAAPNVVQAMETEIKKTIGMSGWAEVNKRGFTKKADIKVPPGAGPQLKDLVDKMRSQIEQMSAPLPEEAVGIGARWQVDMPIENEMLKFSQTAIYTLKAIDGDKISLAISLTQSAPPQPINAPGMGGATAHLKSLKSTGEGKSAIDLKSLVPKAEVSSAMSMSVDIRAGGQQQEMKTDIRIKMTTEQK